MKSINSHRKLRISKQIQYDELARLLNLLGRNRMLKQL